MKRLALAVVLAAVACTIAFAKSGALATLSASMTSIDEPRPLYTTEQERLVSAIAGSILNIAAFADRFDEGDGVQVRNILPAGEKGKVTAARRARMFSLGGGGRG